MRYRTEPPRPAEGPDVPRRAERYKVFEPVRLTVDGSYVRAHLLNVSTSGALLSVPTTIPVSTRFTLEARAITATMHVVRSQGRYIGAVFALPQHRERIMALFEREP